MVELVVGLFMLFLGWLCLNHTARVRARYSEDNPPGSRFRGPKPLMIIPSVLGTLHIIDGLALLTLAAVGWLRISDAGRCGVSSDAVAGLVLAPAGSKELLVKKENTEHRRERAGAALREATQLLQQASELLGKGDLERSKRLVLAAQFKQKEFGRLLNEAAKPGGNIKGNTN